MMNYVLLENIRSAYNVGNIIRTADALWRWVIITGYTPHPDHESKVIKTSLWAEKSIPIHYYPTTKQAISDYQQWQYNIVAAELWSNSMSITDRGLYDMINTHQYVVVLGNEVLWVEPDTLEIVDKSIYIPMRWVKESLNVGQAAAIIMRELWKK